MSDHFFQQTDGYLITVETLKALLPPFNRIRYKYQAGLVCALCNSSEMSGASLAALRSGAGYLRYLYPRSMESKLTLIPELVKLPLDGIEEIEKATVKADLFFIDPSFPTDQKSDLLLEQILDKVKTPLVLDGGALYHIANKKLSIPRGAVMTPDTGEMACFFKINSPLDWQTLQLCQEFANQKEVTIILKGAPTYIFHPNSPVYISAFGHLAMATMGSGDVLTGIVAALLAKILSSLQAAKLAAGLHGLSGEIAARHLGGYSVIASDLIDFLSKAFLSLED